MSCEWKLNAEKFLFIVEINIKILFLGYLAILRLHGIFIFVVAVHFFTDLNLICILFFRGYCFKSISFALLFIAGSYQKKLIQ